MAQSGEGSLFCPSLCLDLDSMTVPDVVWMKHTIWMERQFPLIPPVVWLLPFSTLHFYGREDEILGGNEEWTFDTQKCRRHLAEQTNLASFSTANKFGQMFLLVPPISCEIPNFPPL
jgi:hypothetical protein